MRASGWSVCGLGLALLLHGVCGAAQTLPQTDTSSELHAMSQLAGVIFAGHVVAVRPGGGIVAIDFDVDDAVRGVHGSTYTLREWAGLWAGGAQPFRFGQHYLMLLHAVGAVGLSAPVDGADGAIPIRGGGSGLVVDMRWIQARVVRPLQYFRLEHPIVLPGAVHPEGAEGAVADPPAPALAAVTAALQYSEALEMLRRWERVRDGER